MTNNTFNSNIHEYASLNDTRPPYPYEQLAEAEFWIFDLDNTLYPAQCKLFTQIEKKMTQYVMEFLTLDHDEAFDVQVYCPP